VSTFSALAWLVCTAGNIGLSPTVTTNEVSRGSVAAPASEAVQVSRSGRWLAAVPAASSPPRKASPPEAPKAAEPKRAVEAPRAAEPERAPGASLSGVGLVGVGFPFAGGPAWLRASLRVGVPIAELDPRLRFELVPALSYGWASSAGAFGSTSTVNGFDLVALARLRFRAIEHLHVYGDFGVGVIQHFFRYEIPSLGSADGSSTGAAFRLQAGLEYDVSPRLAVTVEPLSFLFQTAGEATFRFGNTTFTSSTGIGPQAAFLAGVRLWL